MPKIGILCGREEEREAIRYSIEILAVREGFDCSVCCLDSGSGGGESGYAESESVRQRGGKPEGSGAKSGRQCSGKPEGSNTQGSRGSPGASQESRIRGLACVVLCHENRDIAFLWAEKLWQQEPSLPIVYAARGAEDIFAALGMPFFHTVRYFELEQDLKAALRKLARIRSSASGRIGFTRNGQLMLIPSREILYLESEHHEIRLHLGQEVFLVKETLAQCEEKLRGRGFVRTDRSFLVNMYHMRCLERENVLLDNGERLYVSRRRYPEVKLAFENYIRHLDFI